MNNNTYVDGYANVIKTAGLGSLFGNLFKRKPNVTPEMRQYASKYMPELDYYTAQQAGGSKGVAKYINDHMERWGDFTPQSKYTDYPRIDYGPAPRPVSERSGPTYLEQMTDFAESAQREVAALRGGRRSFMESLHPSQIADNSWST